MDAQVEIRLGDSISVILREAPLSPPSTVIGFLELQTDPGQIDGADPIRRKWSLEVSRSQLPLGPESILKLTYSSLDGWYKPAADTIARAGDGWIFDLQRTV